MCWYSDVVDGDWVIDYSPKHPSLLFATGGAGHAFKVHSCVSSPKLADDSSSLFWVISLCPDLRAV